MEAEKMRVHTLGATISVLALAAVAAAQPMVTLTLDSPQNGQIIGAGATVDWSIIFGVSTGDNEGLALLSVDLGQDPTNPALLDIPPAGGVPVDMANFSRPDGISNPGETDPVTGYIGVQRGSSGAMNLVQIGGGQNTFGQALPPGSGIAENANVVGGVGQDTLEVLASGTFTAPTECGTYTFSLANAVANVLVERFDPPAFSPVTEAAVDVSGGSITFTISLPGDLDFDGDVDLSDLAQLLANYGTTSGATYEDGDLDGDGDVDLSDLAELLAYYGQSC
jgi:hypothetical protein